MASIKVKFKPSTVADHEGTIFYQILHERKQRQLFSDYHVFPTEWDETRSMVTTTQNSERKSFILSKNCLSFRNYITADYSSSKTRYTPS